MKGEKQPSVEPFRFLAWSAGFPPACAGFAATPAASARASGVDQTNVPAVPMRFSASRRVTEVLIQSALQLSNYPLTARSPAVLPLAGRDRCHAWTVNDASA